MRRQENFDQHRHFRLTAETCAAARGNPLLLRNVAPMIKLGLIGYSPEFSASPAAALLHPQLLPREDSVDILCRETTSVTAQHR